MFLGGCSAFSEKTVSLQAPTSFLGEEKGIEYELNLKGLKDSRAKEKFEFHSKLIQHKKRQPFNLKALEYRIQSDIEALEKILHSYGYYDAKIDYHIEGKENIVMLEVEEGPVFSLQGYHILPIESHKNMCLPPLEALDVKLGAPAEAEEIIDIQGRLLKELSEHGYPFAKILKRRAYLYRGSRTLCVEVDLDPGPFVRFGEIRVKGLADIDPQFVVNRAPWKKREVFDTRKIEAFRRSLTRTRLFSGAKVKYEQTAIEDEEIPITLSAKESKHRTVSAGAKFATGEGLGGRLGWEHRNITSHGDRFEFGAQYSQRRSLGEVEYRLPDVGVVDQTLVVLGEVEQESADSYDKNGAGVSTLLEREIFQRFTGSAGLSYETAKTKRRERTLSYNLLGVPLLVKLDETDDPLDPKSGGRLSLGVTPAVGRIGTGNKFLSAHARGSFYWGMGKDKSFVLASWGEVGSIAGPGIDNLPADKRLYVGGGGSVRGYGYQMVGPLDASNEPLGGKSYVEFGLEGRYRIHEDWGGVLFVEGGMVDTTTLPQFSESLFWGVGFGVRYHTKFGPIRGDIAFPLRRRRDQNGKAIDSAFQVYISVGQAF